MNASILLSLATSSQLGFNLDFLIFHFSLDWNSQTSIRECWLVGLPDMNQKRQNVRDAQVNLMNHLINLGVAGEIEISFKFQRLFPDIRYSINSD